MRLHIFEKKSIFMNVRGKRKKIASRVFCKIRKKLNNSLCKAYIKKCLINILIITIRSYNMKIIRVISDCMKNKFYKGRSRNSDFKNFKVIAELKVKSFRMKILDVIIRAYARARASAIYTK